jgi:hypothetical protein
MLRAMTVSALASVAFLKIDGFAHCPVTEQARLRAQLEAVFAVTALDLDPAGRIVLDAADGMALVVLRDPQSALRIAERCLGAAAAGLPLAIGLNHGAVRVLHNGKPEAMMGDGIAVAASIAEFAGASRLRTSRAFRDALAEAAPGAEACLVPAGVASDSSLRRYELYAPDERAAGRRAVRYAALSAAFTAAFLAAGIGLRIAEVGRESFVDGMLVKYRDTTAQGEQYFRGLVQKVKLP